MMIYLAILAILLFVAPVQAQDVSLGGVQHTATPRPSSTLRALRQQKMEQRARDILREADELKAHQQPPPIPPPNN